MGLNEQERERIADIAFKHGNIQAAWNGQYPIFFEWDEADIAIMLSLIDRLAQEPDVVRCVECQHAVITTAGELKYCRFWQPEGGDALYLPGDGFCSNGERRNAQPGGEDGGNG